MDYSSIDMTLALGAESFLMQRDAPSQKYVEDPWAKDCFVTLIDLAINAEACFLPERSRDDYAELPALVNRFSEIKHLPGCATISLSASTEKRIFRAFLSFVESQQVRISQWLRSQLWNPSVLKFHLMQADNRERQFSTISNETWEAWNRHGGASRVKNALTTDIPERPYLLADIANAGGLAEQQYCYVFDVYRRGWQYAEATRKKNMDIVYCPHPLREHGLTAASSAWIEQQRSAYWSWGHYLATLVESNPEPTGIEQVVEWYSALEKAKAPKWLEIPDRWSKEVDSDKTRRERREMIDRLEECARAARIPRRRLREQSGASKGFEIAGDLLQEVFEPPFVRRIVQALPVGRVLKGVSYQASEIRNDAANFFRKGSFGYPGLVGKSLEELAAAPKPATYIV